MEKLILQLQCDDMVGMNQQLSLPETTSELQRIQNWLCWEGCRHIQTFWHGKCVCHRTASLKKRGREREQERDVYYSFICSHAVAHTSKLLRSLEKHWHETRRDWHVEMSAVWRACRHMWACVSVCMCMTAFGVYPACVLFLPMRLRARCLLYTELQKWHVRTLMSGNWDNLRQTTHARRKIQTICRNCFITQCLP